MRQWSSPRLKQLKTLMPLSLNSELTRLLFPHSTSRILILEFQLFSPHWGYLLHCNFLKQVSRKCSTCQRAYAKPLNQQMGLLPKSRTMPAPTFDRTGIHFAGSFYIRQGHTHPSSLTPVCLYKNCASRILFGLVHGRIKEIMHSPWNSY